MMTLGSFRSTNHPGFNLPAEAWELSESPLSEFPISNYACPLRISLQAFSHAEFFQ
jgi:hypothetical protein